MIKKQRLKELMRPDKFQKQIIATVSWFGRHSQFSKIFFSSLTLSILVVFGWFYYKSEKKEDIIKLFKMQKGKFNLEI